MLEVIFQQYVDSVGVVIVTIHILASSPEVFGGDFEAVREAVEDISKGVLTAAVLIFGIVAVLMLDLHH